MASQIYARKHGRIDVGLEQLAEQDITQWISRSLSGIGAGTILASQYTLLKNNLTNKLVTNGFYAFVRHPIYTGFRALSLGSCIDRPTLENIVAASTVWGATELVARAEEKYLSARYGLAHDKYAERLPRFLPRLWQRYTGID